MQVKLDESDIRADDLEKYGGRREIPLGKKDEEQNRIPETRIKAVSKKKKEHRSFLSSCKGETSDEGRAI